jgi:pimeloyl-ACP methyl ester carboxylesterase
MVHGFAQNRHTFHHATRSLAQFVADTGREVYNCDLRGHGRSRELGAPWPEGVVDYLELDLPVLVDGVLERCGAERLVMIGHSLGGTLSCLYAGWKPEQVAGVAAIGSPSSRAGRAGLFASPGMRAAGRLVAAVRARGMSAAVRTVMPFFPLDLVGPAVLALDRRVWTRLPAFLRRGKRGPLTVVRPWLPGGFEPEMEEDWLHLTFDSVGIGVLADMFEWARTGRIPGRNRGGDLFEHLRRTACPVLLVSSPGDEIVVERYGLDRSDIPEAAVTRVSLGGFGHCDLVLGRRAPAETWVRVREWLDGIDGVRGRSRSGVRAAPRRRVFPQA